jgi:hypothetical protein
VGPAVVGFDRADRREDCPWDGGGGSRLPVEGHVGGGDGLGGRGGWGRGGAGVRRAVGGEEAWDQARGGGEQEHAGAGQHGAGAREAGGEDGAHRGLRVGLVGHDVCGGVLAGGVHAR